MSETELKARLARGREEVETALLASLDARMPAPHEGSPLYAALHYALSAPGKRLRPILLLEACELVGGCRAEALYAATAIEYVHTYSLIHDDLPAMDDAELRRGRPTVHRVHGEGMALLAGDALLTDAFAILAEPPESVPIARAFAALRMLARGAGLFGMVRGQEWDLAYERKPIAPAMLDTLHRLKTGELIRAALTMGAVLGGGTDEDVARLGDYGAALGLAFQIRDDLLDLDPAAHTGKDKNHDAEAGKATYPALHGVAACEARLLALGGEARAALTPYGARADFFLSLISHLNDRKH